MTGTNCDLFTHKSSRSYLNHLVACILFDISNTKSPKQPVFVLIKRWGAQVFKTNVRHLKILGSRMLTRSKVHTHDTKMLGATG